MTSTAVTESYIETVEEADAFFAKKTNVAAWAGSDKSKALQEATSIIDALPLRGDRYEPAYIENGIQKDSNADGLTQTLEFPRYVDGVLCDYDHGTDLPIIPQKVKDACCWIALSLLDTDTDISEKSLQEAGIQSFSRGKLSVTFVSGAANRNCGLPRKAYDLMKDYIDASAAIL